ncbi:family 43 glycosylhydrolase [Candidatus Chloroploca sp. Khr17]|uniref:family 43 glycosylhydrolase n=1 Tax=Candidatus Chloroploca sp. Khr17 TaxID=2496869 RepID=UPI00101BFDF7|nr:family 43 glycosylhydrolase [Candidatus Chloroploca sp. Khr17]
MIHRLVVLLLLSLLSTSIHSFSQLPATSSSACNTPLHIAGVRLKDHSLFFFDGWYYVVSIRVEPASGSSARDKAVSPLRSSERLEGRFAYARTRDFCFWEELAMPLEHGEAGEPDEWEIWAPHVIERDGTFYMYYTGVNNQIAQTIMLATSTNPADPASWQKKGVIFTPHHPEAFYPGPDYWSDCRDPMVLFYQGRYYLYYTGVNTQGPIVGLAFAEHPEGPWHDLGAVYQEREPGRIPESPYVVEHEGLFYLFYNSSGRDGARQVWRWSVSPFGPWQTEVRAGYGWAYDFYRDEQGWLASYLMGYGERIGVQRVAWHPGGLPMIPRIGTQVYVPILIR